MCTYCKKRQKVISNVVPYFYMVSDDEVMITYAISPDGERTASRVNEIQDEETLVTVDSCSEHKIKDLQSEEIHTSITSRFKRKAKDLEDVETPACSGSGDKHRVNDLSGEETFSEDSYQLKEIQPKELNNEDAVANGRQADKQVVNVLQDEKIVPSEDQSEVEDSQHEQALATVIPGIKHELKEVKNTESIASKRTKDSELKTNSSFAVEAALSEPRTTRDTEKQNILPTGKIAQPLQVKSALINTANAPLSTNESHLKRMKTVETKPSKPLAIEELYYMVIIINANIISLLSGFAGRP